MFVEMKRQADFVGTYLSTNGFLSVTMHGGRFQEQREEALSAFRSNKYRVLVATSVAARGLGKHCPHSQFRICGKPTVLSGDLHSNDFCVFIRMFV